MNFNTMPSARLCWQYAFKPQFLHFTIPPTQVGLQNNEGQGTQNKAYKGNATVYPIGTKIRSILQIL